MGAMLMSDKERLRKGVLEMVRQRRLTLTQASLQCDLSYRQILRVYKGYLEKGDVGLTHQSRGKRSNRKHPHQERIIALYQTKYEGFGPTLASEYLLEEDGLHVNRETLRQWLLQEKLWKKERKREPYRKRRAPMAQFGELVQIDGSIHDWFEIGVKSCLLNMVDDATGKTLARLDSGETTRVVFSTIWKWIERYGIPLAFYVDLKNVYISPKDNGLSHLQIACKKLGIRLIKARSPQAKGRVERNHGVYQDRFVKELRLRQIKTIDAGNKLLESTFIDKLNRKFEKPAQNPTSAHRPLGDIDLNQIFCWEYERQIQHDWTFSFSNQSFQVKKEFGACIKPRTIIQVRKHLDHTISAWYKNQKIPIVKLEKRQIQSQKLVHLKAAKSGKPSINRNSYWYRSHYTMLQAEPKENAAPNKNYSPFRKRT